MPPQFLPAPDGLSPEEIAAWQKAYDELTIGAPVYPVVMLPHGATWEPLPDPRNAAILSVLKKHPHFRANDGSARHVDTLGWPYDFGCGRCHASMRGSSSLDGRGWCETVADIAKALGIEATDE